jgi:hypothetical protein
MAVVILAVALLVYLPLEPTILGGLSGAVYWLLRLLPDGLIVVAAGLVLLVPGPRRREAIIILWVLAVLAAAIVGLDMLRGFSPGTTVNSLRVLLRYVVLGAALLATVGDPAALIRKLAWALAITVAFQFAVASTQFLAHLWPMINGTTGFSPPDLVGVSGTLGRYDRLGFLMVAGILLVLAGAAPGSRRFGQTLLLMAFVGLALSSSRQALLGLALGAIVLATLPRLHALHRTSRVAVAVMAIAMVVLMPIPTAREQLPDPDSQAVAVPTLPSRMRTSMQLSLDPNRNFRMYYNFRLLPWAAVAEPLLGIGPGQHMNASPATDLGAKVEADGMDWSYARNFMNDSNFGSMVIQFGILLPLAFLALMAWLVLSIWRGLGQRPGEPWLVFAIAYAAVGLLGAGFGPAFEVRTFSLVIWLGLFGGFALLRRPLEGQR